MVFVCSLVLISDVSSLLILFFNFYLFLFIFFKREFKLMASASDDFFYHQTKTLISFCGRWVVDIFYLVHTLLHRPHVSP